MKKNYFTSEKNIIRLFVLYAILLSSIQFIYNRSIWGDEALLGLNIIHRSALDVLKPLDYAQVAPPLFLLAEKMFSTLIPNSEYGLRLFPLLSYWGALLFFVLIVRKQEHGRLYIAMALAFFVSSHTFLRYSSEVKQYMTDAFSLLGIFWLVLREYRSERARVCWLCAGGVVAVFLTNVSPIILGTSGIYLCYKAAAGRERGFGRLMIVFTVWALAFAAYYTAFVHGHPLKGFMTEWWAENHGFLCLNPFDPSFRTTTGFILNSMFSVCFEMVIHAAKSHLVFMTILCELYLLGVIWMINRKRFDCLILWCLPLVLHLALSAIHLYPFRARLVLYTFPGMMMVCALGIRYIAERSKAGKWICVIPVLMLVLYTVRNFPIDFRDFKSAISYMEKTEVAKNINVYISKDYLCTYRYYKDIGAISERINIINSQDIEYEHIKGIPLTWLKRNKKDDDVVNSVKDCKGRNWFLLFTPKQLWHAAFKHTLDSLGYKQLDEYNTSGAWVLLYDCGE
ncbi:MAG: hypothetical protein LBH04_02205 [Tannerellaceae bacterium]|jgi:hypothetical protein|nr:hypothetical protein [Tannerellaceae bacterium]